MQEKIRKAEILLEALPYIREFNARTFVIKYGGSTMQDETLQDMVAQDIVLLKLVGINVIIVHGGGRHITEAMEKYGIKSEFRNGLRVTDAATMEIAEMVLSGKSNKDIVTQINRHGGRAVGISGKDGPFLFARPFRDATGNDYGQVGEIDKVEVSILEHLDAGGFIPVISPVAAGYDGLSYNVNADEAAGKIAQAIRAEKLIYLTDVQGVFHDPQEKTGLYSSLSMSAAEKLIDDGIISGGMIPKVRSVLESLQHGVRKVHSINGTIPHALLLEVFTRGGIGTEFHLDGEKDGTAS